jgi:transposase
MQYILRLIRIPLNGAENMKMTLRNNTKKRLEKEITIALKLNNFRLFKISKTLLLLEDNQSCSELAKLFHVSVQTIYNWVSRFITERFSWLSGLHFKGRGAKSKLSKEQKKELYRIVEAGPEKYGFDCGIWNSPMIAEVILREFNVKYNPRYLCRLLKKIGLSYQKAAFAADRTDDNVKKRKEWKDKTWPGILKQSKEENAIILFGDEVSFAQWGSLSRTWAPRGKQPKIKTKGKRKGLKMFGVIEFFGGSFQYMEAEEKFNGESYIEFLKLIMETYSCCVILVEDGAPYHGSAIVKEYVSKQKAEGQLYIYRLPSYSPDYNPIEKLWKNTKRDATHCKFFPTFEDLRSSVVKAFKKYMEDATKVICVMKKLRESAEVV